VPGEHPWLARATYLIANSHLRFCMGCCNPFDVGLTRKAPTLACGKDGAPSGADELGVELAKWYYPAEALAKEGHPAT
jgi:hypothetical protein